MRESSSSYQGGSLGTGEGSPEWHIEFPIILCKHGLTTYDQTEMSPNNALGVV